MKNLISFKVGFFERFAKPNRPKNNMGASLGFFGLVRPLLSDCSESAAHWQSLAVTVTDSESLGMTWNMKSNLNFKLA